MGIDANGLDPEQQALLASIMGKSSQQGSGGFSIPQPAGNRQNNPEHQKPATGTVDHQTVGLL